MAVFTFGSTEKTIQNCELVHVTLKTLDGEMELALLTSPIICEPLTDQPLSLCVDSYEHLTNLQLADDSEDGSPIEVDLLLGSDYYWQLTTGEVRRGTDGPVAVGTKLGWVLSGPAPVADHSLLSATHTLRVTSRDEEESLSDTLRAFWELESLGISASCPSVHQEFEESICFKDGRYEVCLPWKKQHPTLPDNYDISLKRLQGLLSRLRQTPDILQEYNSVICKQLEQGIVQPAPDLGVVGEVHYLPHHAVIKKNRETPKVRVVYDASARSGGPSLNNCLHTGPSFNQKIFDILLRFRTYPVAITADIEKAFLMVSIAERDRDSLRFLWTEDPSDPEAEIKAFRFARVVFGVSSSPFLLNATIDYHLKQICSTKPELVTCIQQSIYVDDVVTGAKDVDSAKKFHDESRGVLQEGGFNLRKFTTNVPELQQFFDDQDNKHSATTSVLSPDLTEETYAKSLLAGNQDVSPKEQKVLGVKWNTCTDSLIFSVGEVASVASKVAPTKRKVMSIVGKFYDPIGFLAPVVIKFKVFFKELCLASVDWDEELSGEMLSKWKSLIRSLQEAPTLSVPRYYLHDTDFPSSFSLHGYCDASKEAYAAVVYLVAHNQSQTSAKFVTSKTRVAPQQEMSIPRLELLSAVLLARLIDSVTNSLQANFILEQPTCCTDSQVSLCWIVGVAKEWKQFVQNRVMEIRRLVPVNCWKHCPGKVNPADLPSRGITPIELSVSQLWHCGPDLPLTSSHDNNLTDMEMPVGCLAEMKAKDKVTHTLLSGSSAPSLEKIVPCKTYHSLDRLFLITSYVIKFVRVLKKKVRYWRSHTPTPDEGTENSVEEIQDVVKAEMMWIQEAQQCLTEDRHFPIWKKQFSLYYKNGIWRCGGRLQYADLSQSEKHPIILPREHHLTTLIVLKAHDKVYHNGTKETLAQVRSTFWVVKGRSLVKKVIQRCRICRRHEGPHYQVPPPPPLPEYRVSQQSPFESTGVDFAGPLHIRYPGKSGTNKVWLCLFTCATTRAVHLELVPDMSASSFVRCLKRFVARRGIPKRFISDNAQTFKCSEKMLKQMMRQKEIRQYLISNKIIWIFNVERAPWWGGLFERMVKSTKRCLRKVIALLR